MALTPRRLRPVQVSDDVASQQAALEPAFRTILAGLARDFAYVDGVGDALVNLRVAVQRMEASITAGEAALWRYAWQESLVLRQPSNESREQQAAGGGGRGRPESSQSHADQPRRRHSSGAAKRGCTMMRPDQEITLHSY